MLVAFLFTSDSVLFILFVFCGTNCRVIELMMCLINYIRLVQFKKKKVVFFLLPFVGSKSSTVTFSLHSIIIHQENENI